MPVITAIEPDPPGTRRRSLFLDGEPWRHTSREVVRALGLHSGQEYLAEDLRSALEAEEGTNARDRALRLLAHRERSRSELRERLVQDGYPASVADATVTALGDAGLVDDERFAGSLARSLASRGIGLERARREMSVKGVSEDLAEKALEEHLTVTPESERALARARQLVRSGRTDAAKVAASLARKGFSAGIAWEAARTALGELPDSGD